MARFCDCEIGREHYRQYTDLLRFALRAIAILLGIGAAAWLAVNFRVIHPTVATLVVEATGVVLGFAALLRAPDTAASFVWNALSVGDWLSVLFFVVSTVLGWFDFWSDDLSGPWSGWLVPFALGSSLLHCVLFWVMMILLMRMLRSLRRAFGYYGQPTGLDDLRKHRAYYRHRIECQASDAVARLRYLRKAATAAKKRRRSRNSPRHMAFYKAVDRVISSYEDSSSWMSAALASGGLFIWAVQHLQPGPLSALLLFTPFPLIPLIYFAKLRFDG